MPIFDSKEYLAIFPKSLVVGQQSPFDCFIFLTLSQRLVQFISAGQTVTEDRIAKLTNHSHKHLFILAIHRQAYYQYLDEFLSTPPGQTALNESLGQGETFETLGFPTEAEFKLKSLPAAAESSAPQDPLLDQILSEIRAQTDGLQSDIRVRQKLAANDRDVLNAAADLISEQLGLINEKQSDFKTVIKNITLKIQDEIIRIKALPLLQDKDQRVISEAIADVTQEIEALNNGRTEEEISVSKEKIQTQLKFLRGLTSEQPENILTHTLEQMIGSVEHKLGKSLNLSIVRKADAVSFDPALLREEQLENTNLADPVLIENLKKLIADQEDTIVSLTEKIKTVAANFTDVKTQLFAQQTLLKRKLDASDQMKGKQILQLVQNFERALFQGLTEERKKLKQIHLNLQSTIENRLKGDEDADSRVDAEIDDLQLQPTLQLEDMESQSDNLTDDALESAEALQTDSIERMTQMDQLLAENKVLLVQIENAQALIDTTNKKVTELEELVQASGSYAQTMEDELQKSKKQNEEFLEEIQNLESERRRLQEGIEDSNNNLFKVRSNLEADEEQVQRQQERIQQLESSLATYQGKGILTETDEENPPLLSPLPTDETFSESAHLLLTERDEQIKSLSKKLAKKTEEHAALKKEVVGLGTEVRKFDAERRDLGKRLEKQRTEQENAKQQAKVTEIKVSSLTNLLGNARKALSKFTTENEELRHDRIKYIRKTNEALADHKSLVGQSMSLNNQLQNEIQRNKNMEQSMEQMRIKEKSLMKDIQSMQSQLNHLEQDKKKVEAKFRRSTQKNQPSPETDPQKITDLSKLKKDSA